MKQKNKKILIYLAIAVYLLLLVLPVKIDAASWSASAGTSMKVGGSEKLSISTSGCAGKFSIQSSDSSIVSVNSSATFVDGNSMDPSITLTAKKVGTATITITAVDVSDTSYNEITGSKTIKITVTEPSSGGGNSGGNSGNSGNSGANSGGSTTTNQSSNNYLKSLKIDIGTLSPAFDKDRTSYTVKIGEEVNQIKVTAVAADSKATITVKGNTNLEPGTNKITVQVKAETGKVRTYVINVIKEGEITNPENAENGLKELNLNALLEDGTSNKIEISPDFSINTYEYTCTVPENTKSLDITAYAIDENAIVEVQGAEDLAEGENTITITVAKEDKETVTYTIKVTKIAKQVEEIVGQDWLNNGNCNNILIAFVVLIILVVLAIVLIVLKRKNKKIKQKEKVAPLVPEKIEQEPKEHKIKQVKPEQEKQSEKDKKQKGKGKHF